MPKSKDKQTKKVLKKQTKKNQKKSSDKKTNQDLENQKDEKTKKKITKFILIISIAIIALVIVSYVYIDSLKSYTYQDVEFQTIQEGELTLYRTSLPVMHQGEIKPYNFYLRTKPSKLVKIPFENSDFELKKISVLSFEKDFDCDGDAVIAIANLMKIHEVAGINILRDENATCDSRYNFFQLKQANKTEIKKIGDDCYELRISNCEILPVTERLMLQMFIELN